MLAQTRALLQTNTNKTPVRSFQSPPPSLTSLLFSSTVLLSGGGPSLSESASVPHRPTARDYTQRDRGTCCCRIWYGKNPRLRVLDPAHKKAFLRRFHPCVITRRAAYFGGLRYSLRPKGRCLDVFSMPSHFLLSFLLLSICRTIVGSVGQFSVKNDSSNYQRRLLCGCGWSPFTLKRTLSCLGSQRKLNSHLGRVNRNKKFNASPTSTCSQCL